MHDIESIFEKMREGVRMGPIQVKELKEAGVPVVGTYCTYTPWELIRAAGGIAVTLCSTSEKPIAAAELHLPRNLCPLIKSSYGFALTDTCPYFHFCDLVVGETTCDGKKKMYEYLAELRPTHVMQLPQTTDHVLSQELWRYEVMRLKKKLEEQFGVQITEEKLQTVRDSDAILREEIAKAGLDRDVWQYFTVNTGVRSVGVMGDGRTYDYTIAIRAITSVDGMTADFAKLPWEVLQKISVRIVNEVAHVNRIVYDITSKPPATVEWE